MTRSRTINLQLKVDERLHQELVREAGRRQLQTGKQVSITEIAAKILEKALLGTESEENGETEPNADSDGAAKSVIPP